MSRAVTSCSTADTRSGDPVTIRTGIIGFGLSGQIFHEPPLAALPTFSVELIATGDPSRAALANSRGHRVVASAAELLDRADELDLVVIATPPSTHAAHALAAFERGLSVVTDKPFATGVAEGESMIAAAKRAGTALFVYQNRRWDSDILTVRRLLAEGVLGTVFRFESAMEKFSGATLRSGWQGDLDRSQGGGVLFDLGSHLVDQALSLFGPARLDTAEVRRVVPGRASEDEAFLSLAHESGVRSHLAMSRVARRSPVRMRVLGTDAGFSVAASDNQEDYLKGGGRVTDESYGQTPETDWGVLSTDAGERRIAAERGDHSAFYRAVAATMESGAPNPVEPHEALAAMRILEEAHRRTTADRQAK